MLDRRRFFALSGAAALSASVTLPVSASSAGTSTINEIGDAEVSDTK